MKLQGRFPIQAYFLLCFGAIVIAISISLIIILFFNIGSRRLIGMIIVGFLLLSFVGVLILSRQVSMPFIALSEQLKNLIQEGELQNIDKELENAPKEALDIATSLSSYKKIVDDKAKLNLQNDKRQKQFLSDVSHELKTPLTAIKGTAETIIDDPDMPQDIKENFLEIIMLESDRLVRMAKDLISMQKIEDTARSSEQSLIKPKDIIIEALSRIEVLLEQREVGLEIIGDAPEVLINRDSFLQIMINLLENASRHAPEKSSIMVNLSYVEGRSIIEVRDFGPGFGDINPQLLFERFYKGDPSRQKSSNSGGTGLGLAIVKQIVEIYGGTIEAYNAKGGGASFIVALPSAVEEAIKLYESTTPVKP